MTNTITIVKDKKGNDVSVGDVVKVAYKKDLYKIHKIVEVDEGEDGKSYPILELAPLEPETIFRYQNNIELAIKVSQ